MGRIGRPPTPLADRFWAKVRKGDGCWEWTAGLNSHGYGKIGDIRGGRLVHLGAHRVSWELHFGPIPQGMQVCHDCDRYYLSGDKSYRRCVRPDHLFLGTVQDNNADKVAKGRQLRGEDVGNAKLTLYDVISLRQEYYGAPVTQRELAARYGVSKALVQHIVRGAIWGEPGLPVHIRLARLGCPRLVEVAPSGPRPCAICGRQYWPLRNRRCNRCDWYWRSHGVDRCQATQPLSEYHEKVLRGDPRLPGC